MPTRHAIKAFAFPAGKVLAGKYEVVGRLGRGWEGEVYLVRELATGIERTAKFFFPHRNPRDRVALFHANKLHRLRHCPIVIQYHTQDAITFRGQSITFLVSEFVEGQLLYKFLKRQRGGRLMPFAAVHLLHALAAGLESIHAAGEYHGDLHSENIMVQRYGLGFELKLLDMFNWGSPTRDNMRHDVVEAIRVFYEALGGQRCYARQPAEVKAICCGMKRSLILKKFRSAGLLRYHLETMAWN
jgi:tRNA A-37 threonylcarbamoyl transferase component Bud32